jgi:RNA polymerase sigma-70 factor, ECF subfamily
MEASQIADLIARAQRREAAAFEQLIDAYSARLYGYFYRLTGGRDDAEDLLQEVYVRLVRMIGQYQHDGRFDAWLFRIATNLVRDRVRRNRKSRAAGLGAGDGGEEPEAFGQHSDPRMPEPGEVVSQAEQADRLQQAIQDLPEPEREVILLRHFSQLSFREIAETMGTPLGTALARAHRGLIHLRQLMREPEGG